MNEEEEFTGNLKKMRALYKGSDGLHGDIFQGGVWEG